MFTFVFLALTLVVLSVLAPVLSSNGDRSLIYQNCLRNCVNSNCINIHDTFKSESEIEQDVWCRMFQWSCSDECKYQCMWQTVDAFKERFGIVPKFYGKWPFIRVLGAQEPASAFSSVLNLASNAYMYSKLKVMFPMKSSQLALFWHFFAFICMNAWIWSTVFHVKDTPFTEFMDYACALSMVVALFVAAVVRVFYGSKRLTLLALAYPLFYFVNHVTYLYTGRVDYEYNMKVNIVYGVVGSSLWLLWAWPRCQGGSRYVWRLMAFTALAGATLALEVLDFAPQGGWDAHALWHLSTSPLPILFYRFVMDDLQAMRVMHYEKYPLKST